jgi:hypothetical protein
MVFLVRNLVLILACRLNISVNKVMFAKTCQNILISAATSGRNQHSTPTQWYSQCVLQNQPWASACDCVGFQKHFLYNETGKCGGGGVGGSGGGGGGGIWCSGSGVVKDDSFSTQQQKPSIEINWMQNMNSDCKTWHVLQISVFFVKTSTFIRTTIAGLYFN